MRRANKFCGWSGVVGLAALAATLCLSAEAWAQREDGGDFDGAVWQFSMKPKARGEELRGRFRVKDHVIYQKETPEDKDIGKQVGKNHPHGKRTKVEITDLRAADKTRTFQKHIKGTALLTIDRFGEWSGTFIDADGRHWDFKCTRVRE